MRHINIPIFIPHLGCPNQCIFCNQRFISGTAEFDFSSVRKAIEETLSTINGDAECEIAFFGGSFTGIDRSLMIELLEIAEGYVREGKVVGVRMSTRPDYISEEIIDILKNYTITCVELGIQTMNDGVLSYLKRGHTVVDTVNATRLLRESGIKFVGQMMVGLPSATREDEIYCAEQICSLGASATRIYPTIVFRHTELEDITRNGEYVPLTLEAAVSRSADVLRIFMRNNVDCIRIGLSDSENLHSEDSYLCGPNCPSMGEMVKSKVHFDNICDLLNGYNGVLLGKTLHIECAKGLLSQLIGHKRKNVIELKNKFGLRDVKVTENHELENKFKIMIKEENSCD